MWSGFEEGSYLRLIDLGITQLCTDRYSSRFKCNYVTEMRSGSEEGSYSMLKDFSITEFYA